MANLNLPTFGFSPVRPVQTGGGAQQKINNPFLQSAMQTTPDSERGVNQPLKQAMFVGYVKEKAVYAGSRLCVLY